MGSYLRGSDENALGARRPDRDSRRTVAAGGEASDDELGTGGRDDRSLLTPTPIRKKRIDRGDFGASAQAGARAGPDRGPRDDRRILRGTPQQDRTARGWRKLVPRHGWALPTLGYELYSHHSGCGS